MFQALLSAISSRLNPSCKQTLHHGVGTCFDARDHLSLPLRSATKMEVELHTINRADVTILTPTLNDIIAVSRLPQGSLTAIWLDVRYAQDRTVSAFFIGHDAHNKAPYVLLRAANRDVYHLSSLQRAISDRFEVSTTEDINHGDDESSVVVRFERETETSQLYYDKRLYQRVMRFITDPAAFGFEAAQPTRLILRDLPISFFAPLNRLGDAPYSIDSTEPRGRIIIDRNTPSLSQEADA